MLFIKYLVTLGSLVSSLVLANPLFAKEKLGRELEEDIVFTADSFAPLFTSYDWGALGSPVIGTSESIPGYAGTELFAGPSKFVNSGDKDYFHGVLPNGRILKPVGESTQVGMNPLGITLTPDGKYAVVSNNDERNGTLISLQNPMNRGGYSLSVLDTSASPMSVVCQINTAGSFFIGLEAISKLAGGYTLYASGGGDNSIKVFQLTAAGTISAATNPAAITINPILPLNEGWVSHFIPAPTFNLKSIPSPASSTGVSSFSNGYKSTFPAGIALSSDSKFLYVACDGDNSLAVIDTAKNQVIAQYPVGYFPYGVSVSSDGKRVCVSNWGLTAYKFAAPLYDDKGSLIALGTTQIPNLAAGFFVPQTSKEGDASKSSSVSVFQISNGDPTHAQLVRAIDEGRELDPYFQVGDTHPSAMATVRSKGRQILYVVCANDDSLGLIDVETGMPIGKIDLPLIHFLSFDSLLRLPSIRPENEIKGTYPNALVASKDGRRLYVAEAGINSVAVLDTTEPTMPKLLNRIPTGWWPSALALSPDDNVLYIVNAKGVGEDINPRSIQATDVPAATGVESFTDSNFIFGTVQKVVLSNLISGKDDVLTYNFTKVTNPDHTVVPLGGYEPSKKVKTVIFIEQENKTFDSMLGSSTHFGPFASLFYNNSDGSVFISPQYTPVAHNTQLLASTFAAGANYYSNSEESDAGHQFCASGTATDYTEKTLLVKAGRGLLVNKNFEPEDYPASGYIFNNAARNRVSFKDYGELVRIDGTDTGNSVPRALERTGRLDHNCPPVHGDRDKHFCLRPRCGYWLDTSHCTIARRCRPCRASRSHSQGRSPRVKCPQNHLRHCLEPEMVLGPELGVNTKAPSFYSPDIHDRFTTVCI